MCLLDVENLVFHMGYANYDFFSTINFPVVKFTPYEVNTQGYPGE
jgi:hypothetical protein